MKENSLYELDFHESTQVAANPYWLWIRVYFPDLQFEQYIYNVCETKSVSIYQSYDPFKAKFHLPATYLILDRMEQIYKMFTNQYFNPENAMAYNVTEDIQLTFSTEKARNRFKKQFAKQLESFLRREEKTYLKILAQSRR